MHNSVKNLIYIEDLIKSKVNHNKLPKIIAVSKTFPINEILPLLEYGHLYYGENKVQEALDKWGDIKEKNNNIEEDCNTKFEEWKEIIETKYKKDIEVLKEKNNTQIEFFHNENKRTLSLVYVVYIILQRKSPKCFFE